MTFKKRGQSSVELLVLLAVGLAVLLAVIVTNQGFISAASNSINSEKAKSSVNEIADAAELVYKQGVGAKTKIYIGIPSNVEKINISGNLIEVGILRESSRSIYRTTGFNVSGNISKEEGNYWVIVEAKDGYVEIKNG